MPRNRKSQKKRSQKTRKDNTQKDHANTPNEEPNTPTEDSNTQNEQSEAQKQHGHKERVRAFVDSVIFGTWPPISTLTDSNPYSNPVSAFEAGRALGNELGNAPELVMLTKDPKVDTFDLSVCIAPGCGRPKQADGATQHEGNTATMESPDLMEPLVSESDDSGPAQRALTAGAALDLADDGFRGVIGDPFAEVTPGSAGTWSGTRSVEGKATHTDTVYPPRPSWGSRRIAALPSHSDSDPSQAAGDVASLPSHTRADPTPSTPKPRIRRDSEVAATPPPAVTRNALQSRPYRVPRMAMRTPTEGRSNFAADQTPPPPNVAVEKPLASPPPAEVGTSDKPLVFPGRRYVRRPM
ncbi:hypothetical protein FN846DRAFT_891651 [Sphaerosporella brunnea]|uniref:Uncharacterized protein n=1 Tax=Sphaerosporella brunnea TaxID=1250544 RepID=A0A5J5ES15_9PEZI|nr:hypothetical protein FN846DRAFT_891651 [Sphaerosporella brunnea]